jgi:hypothetical protein
MSEIAPRGALDLPKKPSYFRGSVTHGAWSLPISDLRSWQHKESRTGQFLQLLETCLLQVSGGFFREPLRYFAMTIFPEDLGLAGVHQLPHLANHFQLAQGLLGTAKDWPPKKEHYDRIVQSVIQACKTVSLCPKSRFVPSWATIAVMNHAEKGWLPLKTWNHHKLKFAQELLTCVKLSKLTPGHEALEPLMEALESCLLFIAYEKAQKHRAPRPSYRDQLWSMLLQGRQGMAVRIIDCKAGALQTAQELDKIQNSRLLIYFATLLAVLPRKQLPPLTRMTFTDNFDVEEIFATTFPQGKPLPTMPDHAHDKHTGGGGGDEGLYVPPNQRWRAEEDQKLSDRSFRLRYSYEAKHGINSSKSSKVQTNLIETAAAAKTLDTLNPSNPSNLEDTPSTAKRPAEGDVKNQSDRGTPKQRRVCTK